MKIKKKWLSAVVKEAHVTNIKMPFEREAKLARKQNGLLLTRRSPKVQRLRAAG